MRADCEEVAMPRYFTHYWRNETLEQEQAEGFEGRPITAVYSSLFLARGVGPGDFLYEVTTAGGNLCLIARLEVERVCKRTEAGESHWDDTWGDDVAFARQSTPHRFDTWVPLAVVEQLRFQGQDGISALKFVAPGILDRQTLRGLRELTPASAVLLDQVIERYEDALEDVLEAERHDVEGLRAEEVDAPGLDGQPISALVNRYERDARLRRAAKRIHGTRCQVCGFSFEEVYRARGTDYIEVHHLKPLSHYKHEVMVNPRTDLAVLCANCHRMIHRRADQVLTLEELRAFVGAQRAEGALHHN
jgi:HNH endonuclease